MQGNSAKPAERKKISANQYRLISPLVIEIQFYSTITEKLTLNEIELLTFQRCNF